MAQKQKLTGQDVAQHNSKESCWVIVHGKAYDVTEFLPGMINPHSSLAHTPTQDILTL
jgi:hypothetical protein